jgi:hypothetical protein
MSGAVFWPSAWRCSSARCDEQFDFRFAPGHAVLAVVNAARLQLAAGTGEITPRDRATVSAAGGPYVARERTA